MDELDPYVAGSMPSLRWWNRLLIGTAQSAKNLGESGWDWLNETFQSNDDIGLNLYSRF